MRPADEVKAVLVRQWLEKARQDLRSCDSLLREDPPLLYPACFHAQQAAEKYLKALLAWRGTEFPKTHSIEQLLDLVERADAAVASQLVEAQGLTAYGVDIRYPGDQPEPTLEETRRAVGLAGAVRDAVLAIVLPPGRQPSPTE